MVTEACILANSKGIGPMEWEVWNIPTKIDMSESSEMAKNMVKENIFLLKEPLLKDSGLIT